jgi:hypothetical protein
MEVPRWIDVAVVSGDKKEEGRIKKIATDTEVHLSVQTNGCMRDHKWEKGDMNQGICQEDRSIGLLAYLPPNLALMEVI